LSATAGVVLSAAIAAGPAASPAPEAPVAAGAAWGHRLSSTCGMNQENRNASAAIGTATRNTVWIDSA